MSWSCIVCSLYLSILTHTNIVALPIEYFIIASFLKISIAIWLIWRLLILAKDAIIGLLNVSYLHLILRWFLKNSSKIVRNIIIGILAILVILVTRNIGLSRIYISKCIISRLAIKDIRNYRIVSLTI